MTHRPARRLERLPWTALVLFLLAGGAICLADSAPELYPPAAEARDLLTVELESSHRVGLAPLTLDISGVLRAGEAVVSPDGGRVVLAVTSTYHLLDTPEGGRTVVSADSLEDVDPLQRSLVLNQPGTYTFRWLIEDEDGNRLTSNIVHVHVL